MSAALVLLVLCTTVQADVLFLAESGGTHSDIQQAIDDASDGDILVLAEDFVVDLIPIINPPVTISGKGLTIVGKGGTQYPTMPPLLVTDLPAGSSIVLRHLFFDQVAGPPGDALLSIRDCAGTVIVEECLIGDPAVAGTYPDFPTIRVDGSANVSVARSQILGGNGPYDLFGFSPMQDGENGVKVTDSRLTLNSVFIRGGFGGSDLFTTNPEPGGDGAHGLSISNSEVWLIGSTVLGGSFGTGSQDGLSAAALHLDGASTILRELDSEYIGGTGAIDIDVHAGTQIRWLGEAVTLKVSKMRVPGQTGKVEVDGPAHTLFGAFISFSPGFLPVQNLHGVLTLGLSTLSGPIFIATIPPTGHFELDFPVQAIGGLEGFLMLAQVISDQGPAGLVLSNASTYVQVEVPVPF